MPTDEDLRGYVLMDARGQTVGGVTSYWREPGTGRVLFAAVRTGLFGGAPRLVPLEHARLDEERRLVRVPYERARILKAPTHAPDAPLERADAEAALSHYRAAPPGVELGAAPLPEDLALHEERVHVDKRLVEGGGVRLRKVVRRETIHVPVEVLREEIVVEHVGPGEMPPERGADRLPAEPFREGAVFLPTWREEPLVSKTTEVVGGVRATRSVETRREVVRAETRREDVEVERERAGPGAPGPDRDEGP